MGFTKVKTTDNRAEVKEKGLRQLCINGRTWTRRAIWLENENGVVKIKFDVDYVYAEYIVPTGFAQQVWDRFKEGQSIADCVSIFGTKPPKAMKSKRAAVEIAQPCTMDPGTGQIYHCSDLQCPVHGARNRAYAKKGV